MTVLIVFRQSPETAKNGVFGGRLATFVKSMG